MGSDERRHALTVHVPLHCAGRQFDTSPPAFCASSMDTNTGISIQVSHYDCYGVAENNQCEGGFFIQVRGSASASAALCVAHAHPSPPPPFQPKDTDVTNAWIIAAVIVVVVAALAGIVVVRSACTMRARAHHARLSLLLLRR